MCSFQYRSNQSSILSSQYNSTEREALPRVLRLANGHNLVNLGSPCSQGRSFNNWWKTSVVHPPSKESVSSNPNHINYTGLKSSPGSPLIILSITSGSPISSFTLNSLAPTAQPAPKSESLSPTMASNL